MSVTTPAKSEGGVGETVRVVIHALIIALVIRTFLFQPFNIPSGSMKATLLVGDYLFVSKYSYGYSHYSIPLSPRLFTGRIFGSDPERGDIVVFRLPKDDTTDYIKRVIGLPGETVTVKDGKIYIDGKEQTQAVSFCPEEMAGSFGPYEVPEDSYFVMGDNRNNSLDSRYWDNTYVKKEAILAKAGFRYWPLNKVGFVNKSAEK